MKTILSLPSFQRHRSAAGIIGAMARLFRDPRRHVRGPFYSSAPGNGEPGQFNAVCIEEEACATCASGAKQLFMANERAGSAAAIALNKAASQLLDEGLVNNGSYVGVSEEDGLPALRKVINRALKNLRAAGRA